MTSAPFSDADNQLIDDYFAFAKALVKNAGELVREGFSKSNDQIGITTKSKWDLVTAYDKKVEEFLMNTIRSEYSDHKFITEESEETHGALTDDPTWIIDPIDGTNNFVQRIPLVAISVAFVWKKVICIGIIYNPIINDFYSVRLGGGSFLNDKTIHCSDVETIEKATLGHEVSFIRAEKYRDRNIKQVIAFASAAQGMRSFGSCCISLSFLARGTIDGYQISELSPWDIAAGVLLIREAGGYCCKPDGSPVDLDDPKVICAATKKLCDTLVELNKEATQL